MWWARRCTAGPGDRSCTLRPEGTASVVRALQHGLLSQGSEAQYAGPMSLRAATGGSAAAVPPDRSGGLGAEQARSDVEVIALAWDLLASLGVGACVGSE